MKTYKKYQQILSSNNSLDFEDIINNAYLKLDDLSLNYKYIIVDEYQDISYQRFNLIKKASDISGAKIIAVGDDWQTIYSFSGSEISLFTDFEKIVGYTSISLITNTYRNSQQLIDIAGNFIMCNKNQIKKQLKSVKQIINPVIIVYYIDRVKSLNKCLENMRPNTKILLLGRYNFDIKYYLGRYFKKQNEKIISIKFPYLDITFLSVHSAKGLGFDNVIILNCNSGIYGFPSKVETDSIFNLITNNNQLEEERRLFYVALTRTKNKVYILSDKNNPSIFVEEIKKFKNVTFM